MSKKTFVATVLTAGLLATAAQAQTPASPAAPAGQMAAPQPGFSEAAADALRQDLVAGMKSTIALNLKLTPEEAARFWPVYDAYAHDLTEVKAGEKTLIQEYVAKYGRYDDKSAADFIRRGLQVDIQVAQLRASYVPKVEKALPALKAATFFQLERGLTTVLDLKITGQLPLLQDQAVLAKR